jgi:hypothetical protein
MNAACSICELSFCKEAQIDNTEGCCLCYNDQMLREDGEQITLCAGCRQHLKFIRLQVKIKS